MSIEEIKASICDNYCKYPFNTETQAELNEICKECPLNELEPCEDAVSREAVLNGLKGCVCEEWIKTLFATMVKDLPSITLQRKSNADEKHVGNTLDMRCKDAISRQAAIDTIDKWLESSDYNHAERNIMRATQSMLYDLPSVTQKSDKYRKEAKRWKNKWLKAQKSGKWIAQQEANGDDYFKVYDISGVMTYAAEYKCDKCGFIQICIEDHGQYKYCPNCGVRMESDRE